MAEHPLFNGTGLNTVFRASLAIPAIPPGECIRSPEEFRKWLEQSVIDVQSANRALFAYTAGPAGSATADDRDKPRVLFDQQGRFLGLSVWISDAQGWSVPGVPGELKTIVRSEITVADDMAEKQLSGWVLCDGSSAAAPDLLPQEMTVTVGASTSEPFTPAPSPFFQGEAPDWDIYTVCKVA